MGYESKLFIVERKDHDNWVYGEVIAEFRLCCMGSDFLHEKIFTKPIDFEMFVGDKYVTEDKYGEHCCYTAIDNVIAVFEELVSKSNYRRLQPCLALLKGFDPHQWRELVVVHYGY